MKGLVSVLIVWMAYTVWGMLPPAVNALPAALCIQSSAEDIWNVYPNGLPKTGIRLRSDGAQPVMQLPLQVHDNFHVALTLSKAPLPKARQYHYTISTPSPLPLDNVIVTLCKAYALPPCEAKAWGKDLALVAKDDSWYLLLQHPTAQVTFSGDASPTLPQTLTLALKPHTFTTTTPLQFTLCIGEGALPPYE